jgi:prepilin-type N-terminal cleavage/methylation domain-containing protein
MGRRIRALRERRDQGFSLIELTIAMLLLSVLSALVAGAVVGSQKMFRVSDNQTRGLEQVKVAAERLDRDVRDARAVLCNPAGTPSALATSDPNCTYHLQLWIDYNSDYVQQQSETITWQLQASSIANHYSLVRSVAGSNHIESDAIVRQVAFSYDYAPAATITPPGQQETERVDVTMTYDALHRSGTSSNRTVTFSDRLRNAT